jgi:pyrroline-5-carboxylate reductase
MHAVTAMSGSGPAYCFMMMEAMADAGVKNGLPRNIAEQLAANTMMGASKMFVETGI